MSDHQGRGHENAASGCAAEPAASLAGDMPPLPSSASRKKKKKNKKTKKKSKKPDAGGDEGDAEGGARGGDFDVRNAPVRGDSMAHASPGSARDSLEVGSSNGDALPRHDGDGGNDDADLDDGDLDDGGDDGEDDDDGDFTSESEEEDAASYKTGGYHPVKIGDVYNGRFEVLEKLGWGHFSTVWKCRDRETSETVAMKVQKSARHYREAAEDEIELLECTVKAAQSQQLAEIPIVRLVDSFQINGPNGLHVCMVFEMLGDNLLTLIKHYNYRGIPMPLVKTLTRDMLEGLAFLHSKCRIIHTDLKPENVLLNRRIPRLPRLRRSLFWKERRAAVGSASPTRRRDARSSSEAQSSSVPTGVDGGDTTGLSREEKKKLKKKLKKKRQKQKKQAADAATTAGDDDEDGDDAVEEEEEDNEGDALSCAPATAALASSMAELSLEGPPASALDAAFASNFVAASAVLPTPRALSNKRDADDADVVDDDNWIDIPPEHCARVMVVLGAGHIAGSRRKELEFTIRHDAERQANGWTSFVLRSFDRVDDAYIGAYETHVRSLLSTPRSSATATATAADPFQIWRLELDVRYAAAVFAFLEKRLSGLTFLSLSPVAATSPLSLPGFHLPPSSAATATAAAAVERPALVLQALVLPAKTPLRLAPAPLEQRLAPWLATLQALRAAPSFDALAMRGKICDLGNACWTHKHFTDDIQTRQYRSPEVILGKRYDTSADLWSMACFVFELLTGDLLFDPKHGRNFNRDEDHLAQMMELLGRMPKPFLATGRHVKEFFNRKGELKRIRELKFWNLEQVLVEKYRFGAADARELASFLEPMLRYDPARRATAEQCLEHAWLRRGEHEEEQDDGEM
ncbi:hypothetical protein P43SY_009592 [Pythium insidiosum]|uniref:non-specific serine/threonine protein kinase n=1 Tax=Pythium insidiosum TaxID=114742 RepID=A0AAD5Q613_PYTIN|nr:hypothetical protein P43SY_009592 [Pythium insidiosum]